MVGLQGDKMFEFTKEVKINLNKAFKKAENNPKFLKKILKDAGIYKEIDNEITRR